MSLTIRFEIIDEAEEEPAIDLKKLSMAGNSTRSSMRLALKKAMAAERQEPAPVETRRDESRRVCHAVIIEIALARCRPKGRRLGPRSGTGTAPLGEPVCVRQGKAEQLNDQPVQRSPALESWNA